MDCTIVFNPASSLAQSFAVFLPTTSENNDTDDQINILRNALLRELTRKYRAHNELAPINQLPFEILGKIFRLLLSTVSDFVPPWRGPSLSADLISVTQVCKRWGEIAVATPSLWPTIATNDRDEAAAAFLRRSGTGQLSVLTTVATTTAGTPLLYVTSSTTTSIASSICSCADSKARIMPESCSFCE
ncbi:uncharacterized protein SCHCODRAFT_02502208 [Schizophyllum commune H4-8]|nr:uncharacterized protein SCHCODRAFT_02502208 [Schizophyllum commune H4-8]KAI5892315.1 hypothetical protein SCHCODRAFT_02502208 [Schizophyllum commune H4-8]